MQDQIRNREQRFFRVVMPNLKIVCSQDEITGTLRGGELDPCHALLRRQAQSFFLQEPLEPLPATLCLTRILPGDVPADKIFFFLYMLLLGFVAFLKQRLAFRALLDVGAVIARIGLQTMRLKIPDGINHAIDEVAVV